MTTDWPPQYDVMSVCGIPLLISQSSIDSWYIHLLNSRCRTITLWKGGVSTFRDERGLYFTELKPEINTLTSLEETLSATLLFAAKRNFNKFVEFGDFSQIEQWEHFISTWCVHKSFDHILSGSLHIKIWIFSPHSTRPCCTCLYSLWQRPGSLGKHSPSLTPYRPSHVITVLPS